MWFPYVEEVIGVVVHCRKGQGGGGEDDQGPGGARQHPTRLQVPVAMKGGLLVNQSAEN